MSTRISAPMRLVVVVVLFFAVDCAAAEGRVELRYKGPENVSYLVERTFKWIKNRDQANSETRHQRAIIKYGESTMLDTGMIHLTPEVYLLSEEGTSDKLRAEFRPLQIRFRTGIWTDGWRSQIQVMARDYDMFPVFPESSVEVGDSWEVGAEFSFPCVECRVPGRIRHTLEGIQLIKGKACLEIKYAFSASLDTREHPEISLPDTMKQTGPVYSVTGEGTAYFDPGKGIMMRQEHYVEWTHRWTGKLKAKLLAESPHWRKHVDDMRSSRILVNLISEEEATRLLKQAEEARTEAAKPKPDEKAVPQWEYYVQREIVQRDRLRNRQKSCVDHALVRYGDAKPSVTYVDEYKKPMDKSENVGRPFQPLPEERLSLTGKLPDFVGLSPYNEWPVSIIAQSFDILPMMPEDKLILPKGWISEIQMSFGGPEARFTATVDHSANGYEQRNGRRCLRIEYRVRGEFKSADHPERFDAQVLREHRAEYTLSGKGVAYFEPEEGILVGKQQTITWTTSYERLRRLEDGELAWICETDEEDSVNITVSLEAN